MHAALGVFERASIAFWWVSKMFGFAQSSEEAFEDDDEVSRRLVAGEYQHPAHPHGPLTRPLPHELPCVCVQLPVYNEPAVARRVIDAACLLRWPRDLLEIQILDDSDDEACKSIVETTTAAWRERGLMSYVMRRAHRLGFKSGALEAGRKKTAADLITVFDADCVPPAEHLERVVPHFYGDDGEALDDMAMVQARWGFLNYDDCMLTMAQSMRLEADRAAGGAVLSRSVGCVVAAASGATWSARAMSATGGWDATALLESTDLALRAYCTGYKSKFLSHTVVMTELPGTFAVYKDQQERWAQGFAQITKRHSLAVLRMHGKPLWQR
jgi:cellulose synthase/poly-beta-1,6-N-acetylglucosamine synthase-like glycosyltransferase